METTLTGAYNFLYFFFNGQIVYRREFQHGGNVLDTYVLDRLGNTNIVSGYSGAWDQSDYYPFGGERPYYSNVGNHYKFSGKERDSESGLDNFGARFNASSMGRFMSPDPGNAGASIDTPQSWNGYSYALNNPVNFIDPSGLLCVDANGEAVLDEDGKELFSDQSTCMDSGDGNTWIDPLPSDSVSVSADGPDDHGLLTEQESYADCIKNDGNYFSPQHGLKYVSGGRLGDGWIAGTFLGNNISSGIQAVQDIRSGARTSAANNASQSVPTELWLTQAAGRVPNISYQAVKTVSSTTTVSAGNLLVSVSKTATSTTSLLLPVGSLVSKAATNVAKIPTTAISLSVSSFSAVVCGVGR